jgi:hypothetical protein
MACCHNSEQAQIGKPIRVDASDTRLPHGELLFENTMGMGDNAVTGNILERP